MMPSISNHYWIVAAKDNAVWSSASRAYVSLPNEAFTNWVRRGGRPTTIPTEAELWAVLRRRDASLLPDDQQPPYLVPSRLIVDRLQALGLLEAARAALDAAPLYIRERYNSRDAILATDPDTIALLQSIGADPAVILARPES